MRTYRRACPAPSLVSDETPCRRPSAPDRHAGRLGHARAGTDTAGLDSPPPASLAPASSADDPPAPESAIPASAAPIASDEPSQSSVPGSPAAASGVPSSAFPSSTPSGARRAAASSSSRRPARTARWSSRSTCPASSSGSAASRPSASTSRIDPGDVAFYLMSNGSLQLLMVDVSVDAGARMFVADSRAPRPRPGVPRIDIADRHSSARWTSPSSCPASSRPAWPARASTGRRSPTCARPWRPSRRRARRHPPGDDGCRAVTLPADTLSLWERVTRDPPATARHRACS